MVLVDATHEDHFGWLTYNLLSPDEMEEQRRFASGDNPEGIAFDTALVALQQAKWRLDVPLVVLMRDRVPPEEQPPEWSHERETRLLATWREVQVELAARSSHGRLMVAERSGHNIHRYRPDLIVEAIREVVNAARILNSGEGNWLPSNRGCIVSPCNGSGAVIPRAPQRRAVADPRRTWDSSWRRTPRR